MKKTTEWLTWQELLTQYMNGLESVNNVIDEHKERKEWLTELLHKHKTGKLSLTEDEAQDYEKELLTIEADLIIYNGNYNDNIEGIESSYRYAAEYLYLGHEPDPRHGIEKKAAYYRDVFDPEEVNKIVYNPGASAYRENKQAIKKLKDILWRLTEEEKEIYVLKRGYNYTLEEVAEVLGKKIGTVKSQFQRAIEKVEKNPNVLFK